MSDLTRDDFLQALKDKKRAFEHMDFENMDLRGIDLRGLNFTGSNLSFVKFNGNFLTETNLTRADLSESELSGCKLMNANLEGAILRKADLTEANLTGARLQRADLRGADMSRAICAEADLRGADLTRAKLSVVDFRLANLGRANFTGAMMRGALLRGADLREAILDGATGIEQQVSPSQTIEAPLPKPGATATNSPSPARTQAMAPGRTQAMAPGLTQNMVAPGILARPAGQPAPSKSTPKAKKYHPPLRQIPALIFTSSGWIRGQFHLPVMHGFLDFLNRMGDLLKLTDVTLPHLKRELAFFGLRRDSAIMIIPDCEEANLSLPTITGKAETHQTSFLMATGSVTGHMTIEADIRVSDYLNQGRWVVLRDCEVGSHAGAGGRSKVANFPLLVLNTSCVIGTSDESLANYE